MEEALGIAELEPSLARCVDEWCIGSGGGGGDTVSVQGPRLFPNSEGAPFAGWLHGRWYSLRGARAALIRCAAAHRHGNACCDENHHWQRCVHMPSTGRPHDACLAPRQPVHSLALAAMRT